MPFLIEVQTKEGDWEPRGLANSEEDAQAAVRAGKALRKIQGVRDSEWRVVYVPKEGWA